MSGCDGPLDSGAEALYLRVMTRIFDMSDRARLPWRFFGALTCVTGHLWRSPLTAHPTSPHAKRERTHVPQDTL